MNETKIISDSNDDLLYAAGLIKKGFVVGMPTETVYGLGADAENEDAVRKIFEAKGRPSDNPLIVHICSMDMIDDIAHDIPELAYRLAEKFWPGPLTMILPKKDTIPYITSGGLDTVGIRMPLSECARKLIELSGRPIAAPSANRSGYPSPTTAMHVYKDMNGRIPVIIDGGECTVGVESTVISFDDENTVRILRPGYVTAENLSETAENVIIDSAVTSELKKGQKAASPGMKYKHYSPKADVVIIDSDSEKFREFVAENAADNVYFLAFDDDNENNVYSYGNTDSQQAHNLFSMLRSLDDRGAEKIYVRMPQKNGVGLAVYNRLVRAAGFEVISL
ncbi:MAG TPA: threonylcarbamoyl-AMP synthase [Ruminococcus sp.]|nr:threonylcarbamoyl-AMP synthase [Ruminococcus sp.]